MKRKLNRSLAVAALLLGGTGLNFAQTADYVVSSFDANANGTGIWYGSCTVVYDSTQDATGNGGGSLYITCPDDASSDTPLNSYICIGGANPYYRNGTVNLTLYKSIDFDIKWDNTSALTVDQFCQPATWPTNFGPAGTFSGSDPGNGINIKATDGAGNFIQLGSTNIPAGASNGWVHMSFPINASTPGIGTCNGVDFEKWINNNGSIIGEPTVHFWVDNITFKGTAGPPPPPILVPLTKAVTGLNIIASTEGNSFYDRQSVLCNTNHGVSWVGQASSGNPVTYSFKISGFPTAAANQYGMEAYMFLVPNPTANDNAPDYNESNCIIAEVQSTPSGSQLILQYKVNESSGQGMQYGNAPYTNAPGSWDGVTTPWYETGNLGALQSTLLNGTYSLKFTSSSNVTLITPDGNSTNLLISPYYTGLFAESSSFNVYFGMQANNAASINQAVVYSGFSMTGNVNPVSDNFLTETTLNTNLWNTGVANNPRGVILVPASAAYWANWTLPATGYSLETGSNLLSFSTWTSPGLYPVISVVGQNSQLIDSSELPAGNAAFFNTIQRVFSQLQILLPGQTNAPGTTLGYVGSPTPVSLSGSGGDVDVTVNAVDSTFHIINGVSDSISLTTTDGGAYLPSGPASLVNGTVTFSDGSFSFSDQGNWTITATDATSTNIMPVVSAPVSVGP